MADEHKQQEPDRTPPSEERQAELEAAYEKQKDTDAPYISSTISNIFSGAVIGILIGLPIGFFSGAIIASSTDNPYTYYYIALGTSIFIGALIGGTTSSRQS